MYEKTLYLSLEQSIMAKKRKVCVGDVAKLFCTDPKITDSVSKLSLFTFPDKETSQQVITAIRLIQVISQKYKDITVIPMAESETIVYYQNPSPMRNISVRFKALLLMIFAFFGTGYSIMSYNGDVGSKELLEKLYTLFTGNPSKENPKGLSLGIIMYSVGLCIGMIIFFNRGINKKNADDPTPLQVQMRLYEQDVNQSIIIDSGRNKETIDVD